MAQLKSTSVIGNLSVTNQINGGSFVKAGGTSSQLLLADGGILATDTLVTRAGAQTISGLKTFTTSIKFYNSSTTANSILNAIAYQSNTRTGIPIKFISGDENGNGILIGDGGATIIGGGEAAASLWGALGLSGQSEELHLANDQAIKFHSNCQTVANRKTTTYDASGNWTMPGSITATSFIKNGGNNTQILMADGTTKTWYPASSCTSFTDDVGTLSPAAVKKAVTETFSSAAGNRGNGILVKAAAAGQINSEKYAITSSGTVKATWQYNAADDCIELGW